MEDAPPPNTLLCAACVGPLTTCHMLPCWHAVCAPCLPTLHALHTTRAAYNTACFDATEETDMCITCPACDARTRYDPADPPPSNVDVEEAVAAALAAASGAVGSTLACDRCGDAAAALQCAACAPLGLLSFCQPCADNHHAPPHSPLAAHVLAPLGPPLASSALHADGDADADTDADADADAGSDAAEADADAATDADAAADAADADAAADAAASTADTNADATAGATAASPRSVLASDTFIQHCRMCELHDLALTHHCTPCGVLACVACATSGPHGTHATTPLATAAAAIRPTLATIAAQLDEWTAAAVGLAEELEAAKQALAGRTEAHGAKWDALEEEVIDAVRARFAVLKAHSLGPETAYEARQLDAEGDFFALRAKTAATLSAAAAALDRPDADDALIILAGPLLARMAHALTVDAVPPAPHVAPDNCFTLLAHTKTDLLASIEHLGSDDFYQPVAIPSPPTPPPRPPPSRKMPFGYFTDTALEAFPPALEENTHWKRLILARNFITAIPPQVAALTNLAELDLSHNALTAVPPELGALALLAKLKLGGNKLDSWPAITDLPALTDLDLGFNAFTALPPHLAHYTSLTKLNVRANRLAALDADALAPLGALATLDVSENCLVSLGPALEALTALVTLALDSNQLVSLPSAQVNLPLLATLGLAHNDLDALPSWLWMLPSLQSLDASFNEIRAWPAPEGAPATARAVDSLTSLNLRSNGLATLPVLVTSSASLETLNVAANALMALPDSIGLLTSLEVLNVGDNELDALPDSLGSLAYLVELNVWGNALTALPDAVCTALTGLVTLTVGNNNLAAIPDCGALEELEELAAAGNALTALPPSLDTLPNLTALYLGRNAINAPPADVAAAFGGRVTRGDISHNAMAELPAELIARLEFTTEANPASPPLAFVDYNDAGPNVPPPYDMLMAGKAYVTGSKFARFDVGMAEMVGKRPTMEDALTWHWGVANPGSSAQVDYFGLFDGHAGTAASAFCAERLHRNIFGSAGASSAADLSSLGESLTTDGAAALRAALEDAIERTEEELCAHLLSDATPKSDSRGGTTGLFAFFVGTSVAVANVGDSRAILIPAHTDLPAAAAAAAAAADAAAPRPSSSIRARKDSAALHRVKQRVRRLSMDHKPTLVEEQERIRQAKAHVAFNGRVNGNLAVSRAFGDFHLKPYVIASPFCAAPVAFSPGDMLIMACDGVWDEVSDARAAKIVTDAYAASGSASYAASVLRDAAYMAGSTDNISVIVIRHPAPP